MATWIIMIFANYLCISGKIWLNKSNLKNWSEISKDEPENKA